jgi:hypothetical protein
MNGTTNEEGAPDCRSLCTFEEPAARHLINQWKSEMRAAGRLLSVNPAPEDGVETIRVRRESGEVEEMTLVPFPGGRTSSLRTAMRRVWVEAGGERDGDLKPFYKHVHFGIFPWWTREAFSIGAYLMERTSIAGVLKPVKGVRGGS